MGRERGMRKAGEIRKITTSGLIANYDTDLFVSSNIN